MSQLDNVPAPSAAGPENTWKEVSLPRSVTRQSTVLTGVISLVLAAFYARNWLADSPGLAILLLIFSIVLPLLIPEWRKRRSRISLTLPSRAAAERIGVKLVGLIATYAVIGLAYWTLPFYREGQVDAFFSLLWIIAPILLLITPIYIWLTDLSMEEPRDGCFMAGLAVLGGWNGVDREQLTQYALSWLVKAFFLPLMFSYAYEDIQWFLTVDLVAAVRESEIGWYSLAHRLIYGGEVLWVTCGYLLTLRLFDTHIRSTDRTTSGWLVCILCYFPFWPLFATHYFVADEFVWGDWLSEPSLFRQAWACLICVCLVIFAWSDLSFGPRFSNLTHRGIITNGPYRWSKHPAYIAKNASWWLIEVPFIVHASFGDAIQQCIMLACVNGVYYLRAKTEERHLSRDPVYREYAAWIAEHGLIARLSRWRARSELLQRS